MKFLSQINVNTEYILPFVDGTNGQVLTTDGNGAVYWGSVSAGATNLNALTDVELTSPSTGQILRYEIPMGGSVPVWRNVTPGYLDPNSSINALGDVTITSAVAGQILQFNGTFWINTTLSTVEYVSKVQHTVKAGVAITKGQAVYVTTSDGTNMIVGLASNTSEATSSKVIGLAASNAAINDQIFVVTEGLLAGLNTSTATAGDPVWLGTNGNLIFGLLNKPASPAHLVYIGVVTRAQQNNGEIFVNVQNGIEIDEIHDVQISSPATGQLLRRDSDGYWKNWSPNFLTAEADTLNSVTGRGATTTNAITVGGLTVDTSTLVVDATNNRVGIGTASPLTTLDVVGHTYIRGGLLYVDTIAGYSAGKISLNGSTNLIVPSGNVGVGTTTPQKFLDVNGSGIVASFGGTFSPGSFAGIHFGYSESNLNNDSYKKSAIVFERTDNHGQGGNASGKIHFLLNNIAGGSATSLAHSVMVIDTNSTATQGSARVGIGTTSPNSTLDVNGAANATSFSSTALFIANADTSGSLQPDQGSPANKIYSFRWAGGEQGYIDTDAKITFAGFKTPTGTASQFLKANGTVDSNVYITSAALSGYATQAWVNSNFYTQGQIDDFFGGAEPISGYNKSNWDAAYNDKVNSASFNTTNGILTLTQQDGGTVTVDLDGRYLTSDTDAQTLTWDGGSKTLGITNGNDVILSELATEDFVTSQGYVTSSHTHTIANVTGLQTALDGKMPYYHNAIGGDPGTAINGVTRIYPTANGPIGAGHFTVFTALQDSVNYGWQFTSVGNDAYFRSKDTTWGGWQTIATQSWVQAQGYLTSETDSQTLAWDAPNKNISISNGNTVTLDGLATEEFVTGQGYLTSLPSHNHDDRYYTESESDSRFVNVSGDTMNGSLSFDAAAVIKKKITGVGDNPVKTASGVLASRSDNGGGYTYYVIETNVPQDDYQMGGFTIELLGRYGETNHKTKIDLGGYWNAESNSGFIGFEAHGTNPQYKPTIEVARNSAGKTAFIIYGVSWSYPVIVARDLWLGYSQTDGGSYGEGWSITGTNDVSSYTNKDTVVWRNAYSDSNPAGYITGYNETDTLATVTARGASTSTTLNLNGRVNIGNGLARPNALTSDSVAHARIGGADVHLYVASLEAAGGYRVAVQAARTSDFASFGLDLQSNGGTLFYGGNEIATRTWVQAQGYLTSETDSQDLTWDPGSKTLGITNGNGVVLENLATEDYVTSQGYITGYTETDTLATVTGRGASTSTALTFSGGSGTTPTLALDRNIATPSNYYNGLQFEVRATSGTAGIGLHRNGYSHVGIYHDSSNELKFNMNSGTPVLSANAGTIWGSGNDGSGSGLDADLLDGNHASAFYLATNPSGYITGSYLDDYTRGAYRVISDYSSNTTWYIRSNGQFVFGTGHDWTASFRLNIDNGSGYGSNGSWAYFGQQDSNATNGTWRGVRIRKFAGGSAVDGDLSAGAYYIGTTRKDTNWDAAYTWGNHADAPYWNVSLTDAVQVEAQEVIFAGNVTIQGTLTESSSIRFKENIAPLEPSLDKVNQLEAVSYNKIGEDNREIGLIAEDVAELFPEVVTYNEEGQPQGIQYQRLSVILLKAVQELTERVNKLENK